MNHKERVSSLRSLVIGLCNEVLHCTAGVDGPETVVHDDIAAFVEAMSLDEGVAIDRLLKAGQDGDRWNSEVLPQIEGLFTLLLALELLLRKYKMLVRYGVEKELPTLRWCS